MRLTSLDIIVLIGYFAGMIAVGFYVKRRASKNLNSLETCSLYGYGNFPLVICDFSFVSSQWFVVEAVQFSVRKWKIRNGKWKMANEVPHPSPFTIHHSPT